MKKVHVSKAYIELAKDRLKYLKEITSNGEIDLETQFALCSVITNYSYAAIEAFANGSLFKDWVYSKHRFSPQFNDSYVELYNQEQLKKFFDKYGHFKEFSEFKDSDLKELKDKLRIMCDLAGIKRISEVNGKLWGDLNNLLRESRHFLIHIDSSPELFDSQTRKITDIKTLEKYTQIASWTIAHFFLQKGHQFPDYLN